MNNDENKFPDYVTFPRTFDKYKWYKPLITIVLVTILYFLFQNILVLVFNTVYGENTINAILNGGYETLNNSDVSVYYSYLSMIIFAPAIYIASKIVRDRPFSSYSSSRGGWNWKIYFKCLSIPFVIYLAYFSLSLLSGDEYLGNSQVSLMALIISLILIPAQCIVEEHVFRGLLMQTFGAWFKNPILAIIIQAVIFYMVHSYNDLGVISVFISGIIFGLISWRTNGLEAAASIHSINNLMAFFIVAIGFTSSSSTISYWGFVLDISLTLVSSIAVYYIGVKKGWFDEKTPDKLI
ncbi:CPBP family intramembrane glutamic endopeptidase [Methanobrevibacter sp.]|uniref:CPBP family intramembrane glutamic endopeptidase n=1 Tax=Methanobrevibacter sp. TaxID=66852 RepID=UPI003890CE4F